jgi:hypothetical protein
MAERETGRYAVTRVPPTVRHATPGTTLSGASVMERYERATFDKELANPEDHGRAELLTPGHPLVEAVLSLTLDQLGALLGRGAILVDEADVGEEAKMVVALEHAVVDGRETARGRQVVSRRFEFVSVYPDGSAFAAGYAPYLDCRPPTDAERRLIDPLLEEEWLEGDLGRRAFAWAVEQAVPAHLAEVRVRTAERVAKVRVAVRDRLTRQVAYWDARAAELREQATAGRQPKLNPDRAQARADELAARLEARMANLQREEQLSALPPEVVAAAFVVPVGFLARHSAAEAPSALSQADRENVERRAVQAVCAAERAAGWQPEVMPYANPGFDIRSADPDGGLRFIEVKGRRAGAEVFMITRNEILHALNVPDSWVLALVEVGEEGERVRYLSRPFGDGVHLPFDTTAAVLSWPEYWARSQEVSA